MNLSDFHQSYCDNVHTNTQIKTSYLVNDEIERILLSICGVSSPRKIEIPRITSESEVFGIAFMKNNILHDLVAEILEKLVTAGIPQHLYELEQEMAFPVSPLEVIDNRKVLAMFDLSYGFNAFLIALGISTIVFVIEILSFWLPRAVSKVRSLIGVCVIVIWLRNYFAIYRI